MMGRMFACLVVAFLLISVVGCGGGATKPGDQEVRGTADTEETRQGEPQKDPVSESAKEASITLADDKGSLSVSTATDKSVEVPRDYPMDKFPIYKDSYIFVLNELEGGYLFTAFSKDGVDKVMDFYAGVMAPAQVFMETRTDDSFTSFGSKDGYTYNLDIGKSSEMKEYQTSITMVLQPE